MKYFDEAIETIQTYSAENLKTLSQCQETVKLINEENKYRRNSNKYIELATKFIQYNNGLKEECSDWYFYMYLKSTGCNDTYSYTLDNDKRLTVKIKIFEPYDLELADLINPQWHLLISYYAYIDAAYNHEDNKYAKKILGLIKKEDIKYNKGWTEKKQIRTSFSNNKVLSKWMQEVKQSK